MVARRVLLGGGLLILLLLTTAAALLFTPGTFFQPSRDYQPINVSGDTCTSKTDCKQLLVDTHDVLNASTFEQKWTRLEDPSQPGDIRCQTICEYRLPPRSIQRREITK